MALKDAEFVEQFTGLSKQRIYECARLGLIPCVRIGRQVKFDEDALKEWARHGGTAQSIEQPANSNVTSM
jgi:excisionase family DNA binding protein